MVVRIRGERRINMANLDYREMSYRGRDEEMFRFAF
jgi:hypothetical protein